MAKIQDLRSITPRSNSTRSESQIKFIARHHSATTTGDWYTFWPHWNKSRGWGTGGYAEIILRDGTVQLCYDPHEVTNGVANHNTSVYNICIVGNGSFTAAQEAAWDERCRIAMKRFGLPVSAVKGHNEFSGTNTACPGIDMNLVRSRLSGKAPAVVPVSNEVRDYFIVGDNSPGVGVLQNKLNKVGFKLEVDSVFGDATEKAVYAFQRGNGLLADGVAGKYTIAKLDIIIANLNKPAAPKPVPVVKPEEEDTMEATAVVVNQAADIGTAALLAQQLGCGVFFRRDAELRQVAKTIYIAGGGKGKIKGDKFIDLSGKTRQDTAKKVTAQFR